MLDEGVQAGVEGRHPPLCLDGRPFTALLRDDDQARDEALAALLSSLARPDVRVVRMGNSMRSRLMLEHALIQATGPDGRTSLDGNARQIARTIAERQGREAFVVLLITQAETLHSKTLRLLQAMRPYFAEAGAPTLQVVFVGRLAFRALLDERGMTPLQEALGFAARPDKPTRPAIAGVVAPAPEAVERRPFPAAPEVSGPARAFGLGAYSRNGRRLGGPFLRGTHGNARAVARSGRFGRGLGTISGAATPHAGSPVMGRGSCGLGICSVAGPVQAVLPGRASIVSSRPGDPGPGDPRPGSSGRAVGFQAVKFAKCRGNRPARGGL